MRSAVIGHVEWLEFARVERLPEPGQIAHALDWWEEPAGGGSVAAVQLQRLTGNCIFFTALGKDAVAKRAHLELEGLGPRVEAARRAAATRRGFAFVDAAGERTITTLGERLDPTAADPLPWDALASVDCVYVCAADPDAVRLARRARVVVGTGRVADVLAASGVRLDAIVGSATDPAEQIHPDAFAEPPALIVRTEGDRGGSFETAGGGSGRYEAVTPPGPVVDVFGAGDAFAAGLAFALARGDGVERALALAAACGAWCVTGRGPYGRLLDAAALAR